jgi:hypothetical protein
VAGFECRQAFRGAAGHQMRHRIAAFSSCQPSRLGKGVAVCHGYYFFRRDHLLGRQCQGTRECYRSFSVYPLFTAKARGVTSGPLGIDI